MISVLWTGRAGPGTCEIGEQGVSFAGRRRAEYGFTTGMRSVTVREFTKAIVEAL